MENQNNLDYNIITRRALVLGISTYHNKELFELKFCRNDGYDISELMLSLGYIVDDNHKLIGEVTYEQMREAIIDFFTDPNIKADDTLLFYYSGHGIPDEDGDIYLASSEIDPYSPYRKGFSFTELTKMIQKSNSLRIVTILDCCYSGSAKLSKGQEDSAAIIGQSTINDKAKALSQGEGKCLLAASQAMQEAYALNEGNHSIFTYFLIEGLKGNEKSVDINGNVTPYSLGNYIYRSIINLPINKRPKQKPITKVEASGDIILATYPHISKNKNKDLDFSDIEIIPKQTWEPLEVENTKKNASSIKQKTNTNKRYNPQVLNKYQKIFRKINNKQLIVVTILITVMVVPLLVYTNFNFFNYTNSPKNFIQSWAVKGDESGKLDYPSDIDIDSSNNVYVVDSNNHRIQKFTNDGKFLTEWGKIERFDNPLGVALDSKNNVYVTDSGNNRILKFTSEGQFLKEWGKKGSNREQFEEPSGIDIDQSDNVYVLDRQNNRIQKFNSEGVFLDEWGEQGSNRGQFMYPTGVAVDHSGNVYVADSKNNRIQKFTSNGDFIGEWGSYGDIEGRFNFPMGVAVDHSGNVYVADSKNNRIQKFTSNGDFIIEWGYPGDKEGRFNFPYGITTDPSGKIYVVDRSNYRIQVFSSP